MTNLHKVCRIDEVPRGTVKRFKVADRSIMIAHTTEGYYAMDSVCSHKGGDLSKGRLENKFIYCQVHGTSFDVSNGKVVRNVSPVIKNVTGCEASRLTGYPVRVDTGTVWIEI